MEMVEINGKKINVDRYGNATKLTGEGAKIITAELLAELHEKLCYSSIFGDIELPETIKICEEAFRGEKIFSLYAPELIEIEEGAFFECEELEETHALKLEKVGDYAFEGCVNLEYVKAPNIKELGKRCFYGCDSLIKFEGEELEKVGDYAFCSCTRLKEFNAPKVQKIGIESFHGCDITKIDLPNITNIPNGAFKWCTNLATADFANATIVGDEALKECTFLKEFNAPKVVETGAWAFECCKRLKELYVDEDCDHGFGAFNGCKNFD